MSESTLDFFNRLYEPAKRHMDAMASVWDEYEQAYLAEPDPGTKPDGDDSWRSYLFFKYAWQQIQTLIAELSGDDDPTFVWEARTVDQDKYAELVRALIAYQLQMDDYAGKRYMTLLNAAVYGGAPVKYHWAFEREDYPHPVTGETESVITKDQASATVIDPRDFFYDLRARNMREARYAGHRMILSVEELRTRKRADGKPLYSNLDEIEDGEAESANNTLDHDYAGERDKARRKGVEVVELWTRDRVIVRANGVIIRDDPTPFKHGRLPFEVITLIPSLNDVWGVSVVWTMIDVQDLLHTLDRASLDALKLAINPPLAVDITDDPENADRPVAPGERFPSRSPKDAVVPLRVTGTEPFVTQQAIQATRDQLEYVTGISREIAGQSDAGTATQAALNQRQSKGRIGMMLRSVDAGWARIGEAFLMLNQQFLDFSKPVKVAGGLGNEWKLIAPSEIAGVWQCRPRNSTERVVKELHRQNLMEALGALMPAHGMALPSGKTIDITPIIEELAETFNVPKAHVVVPVEAMIAQTNKQTVGLAQGQAQAAAMMPQQPQAPAPAAPEAPNPLDEAQRKVFQSINYKDLPDAAQAELLAQLGLPHEGVEDDNRNPTRPNAGVNPISEGLKAHSAATKGSGA